MNDTTRPGNPPESPAITLAYPGLVITVAADGSSVHFNNEPARLEPQTRKFVAVLARSPGRIVPVHEHLKAVYGDDSHSTQNVDVGMTCLKQALDAYGMRKIVLNRFGVGFGLADPTGTSVPVLAEHEHAGHRLTVDSADFVRVDGRIVDLTVLEFDFLMLLLGTPGHVRNKHELMDELYVKRGKSVPEIKIIDVIKCKVAKKLAAVEESFADFIQLQWGRGYVVGSVSSSGTHEHDDFTPVRTRVTVEARVYGPDDLPEPGARWTIRRKAVVARLVDGGVVSREGVLSRYSDLTDAELRGWSDALAGGGIKSLRASKYPPQIPVQG